jgi:hypothetical protein
MTKQTPTPWRIATDEQGYAHHIAADGYITVSSFSVAVKNCCDKETIKANAAHIVRSVNAHDELVAALQNMLEQFVTIPGADTKPGLVQDERMAIMNARAAIVKATQ